ETDLRRLRRGVGLDAGQADAEARTAGDVDDAPAARLLHAGRHCLAAVEGARDIDVEDRLPIGGADLLPGPARLGEHAACGVDQYVDGGALRRLGYEFLHLSRVRDVDGRDPTAREGLRLRQAGGIDVAGVDPRASQGEGRGNGAAEAMSGPG